ncbi:MAG: ABC transporter permease [Myxococcales bacterium]|nr:ABC transporter permease [Myxococcales bacterium]
MTPPKLLRLTAINLRRDSKSALLSCLGTAVGIGALAFFVALGSGVQSIVRDRLFPIDARALEVVPPRFSLGTGLLGAGKLDEAAVARLSSLDGVSQAFRKMEVRIPAMATPAAHLVQNFKVPGNIRLALIAVGVEPEFIAADLAPGIAFQSQTTAVGDRGHDAFPTLPAMASKRLLALYNQAFARSQGLPTVSEPLLRAAAGLTLVDVQLGRGMLGGTQMPLRASSLAFAGLTDRAPLHGVLIPLQAARAINAAYGQDAETYSAVTLVARDPGHVPALRKAVQSMGFSIEEGERELAEKVGLAVAITTAALALLSILICLIAAINIAHALLSSVRTREREFGLLRALGATKLDVAVLVLVEAALIGLMGGAFGILAARAAAFGLSGFIASRVPLFPFPPESFFAFSAPLVLASLGIALLASLAGAIVPALMASKASPAKVLAG